MLSLAALAHRPQKFAPNLETSHLRRQSGRVHFPSGQWVGFYTYPHRSERFLMDLVLQFRDGIVTGEGWDGIGLFDIDGHYSTADLQCSWKKLYYRKHTVLYSGHRDKNGIWGTWTIFPIKGGFHIWPIGEGAAQETLREEAKAGSPAELVLTGPLVDSKTTGPRLWKSSKRTGYAGRSDT